jgi:hypothetical protein
VDANPATNDTEAQPVVLDFTHDPDHMFAVQFDDAQWTDYASSLKPIGINIELNSCDVELTSTN